MSDLVSKLLDHGIRLPNYSPGDRKVLCPQCSHTRRDRKDPCLSVHVDPDGENAVWMCHHCDWRGNTSDPFERPLRARPVPPPPPRRNPEMPGWTMVDWFAKRGIPPEVLVKNRIGEVEHFIPKMGARVPCIAFPYYRDGILVNTKYRALSAKAFTQERGGAQVFYGLDQIDPFDGGERIIIVEGELDKLAADTSGLLNVLSVPDGAPAKLKDEAREDDPKFEYLRADSERLDGFAKFVIAVDNDSAGEVLAEELARRLGKERCWRVRWPKQGDIQCKDLNETLIAHGPEVVRECIEAAEPYPIRGYWIWDEQGQRERRVHGREFGIKTGWPILDEFMTVAPGQLTVVTGVPNHGKSEFVDALVVNLAIQHGWRFALCSFENSILEHQQKLSEKYMGLPFWDGPTMAGMTLEQVDQASEWGKQHFWFIRADDDSPTIDWLLEKARIAVLRDGINGLVIDPYNEIEHSRPSNMTETEYVSQILGKTKRFAQNHGVHIWFVAHPQKLSRENGKMPVPGLYDISGSAHWANKADVGLTVYRPDPGSTDVEIHLHKVRHKWIGKPGKVTLSYDRVTGRYSEPRVARHWQDV